MTDGRTLLTDTSPDKYIGDAETVEVSQCRLDLFNALPKSGEGLSLGVLLLKLQ